MLLDEVRSAIRIRPYTLSDMRNGCARLLIVVIVGCASRAANTEPEPRVALIRSVPDGADLAISCHDQVRHVMTPAKVAVPPSSDPCSIEIVKQGYRPARARFDASFVVSRGEPLRLDEHHELDAGRVTWPGDVILFPLQRLGDRIQNAIARRQGADYRITIELLPEVR